MEAQSRNGIDLLDHTNFKLTMGENYYIGKLSLKYETNYVPLLITAGTCTQDKHVYVWNEILRMKDMMFPLSDERITPPAAPYIVDMIAPSLYNKLEVFSWTEDFTKCVGWHVLSSGTVIE